MALTSVYYDGPVTETDRAKNLAGAPEYGVYGPDDFKVTAHPSIPYAVLVKAGRAHGHGVTDTAAQDEVVNCTPLSAGQSRWDLIVVRRNWQPAAGGPSTLEAVQAGGTAAIPATRKVGPGVEDDQPLFFVKWQGGTSAPVDFIDMRVWTGNGGLYAKSDLVRTYMGKVGTEININGASWLSVLDSNNLQSWVKGAPRRHARFTASAGGAGTTAAGAEWGFTAFTEVKPAGSENMFATVGPASKIALTPGVYSVVAKGRSASYPGYYYISIKNDANNYTFADGRTDGDWGATASMPVLLIESATNILLGLRTGNSVAADVTVDIFKVSD